MEIFSFHLNTLDKIHYRIEFNELNTKTICYFKNIHKNKNPRLLVFRNEIYYFIGHMYWYEKMHLRSVCIYSTDGLMLLAHLIHQFSCFTWTISFNGVVVPQEGCRIEVLRLCLLNMLIIMYVLFVWTSSTDDCLCEKMTLHHVMIKINIKKCWMLFVLAWLFDATANPQYK